MNPKYSKGEKKLFFFYLIEFWFNKNPFFYHIYFILLFSFVGIAFFVRWIVVRALYVVEGAHVSLNEDGIFSRWHAKWITKLWLDNAIVEKSRSDAALNVVIENSLSATECIFDHWTPSFSQYCGGGFTFSVSIENRNEYVTFSCPAEIGKSVNSVYKYIRINLPTGVVRRSA